VAEKASTQTTLRKESVTLLGSIGIWNIVLTLSIVGGIALILGSIAVVAFAWHRDDLNRPLIPWGARMRVERAKANLELDALEVKRLAIEHQRTRVLAAIERGDTEEVQQLGLPSANTNGKAERATYA
jgi:hypothetical protein